MAAQGSATQVEVEQERVGVQHVVLREAPEVGQQAAETGSPPSLGAAPCAAQGEGSEPDGSVAWAPHDVELDAGAWLGQPDAGTLALALARVGGGAEAIELHLQGEAAAQERHWAAAMDAMDAAVRVCPQEPTALYRAGLYRLAMGGEVREAAVGLFRAAVRAAPGDAQLAASVDSALRWAAGVPDAAARLPPKPGTKRGRGEPNTNSE